MCNTGWKWTLNIYIEFINLNTDLYIQFGITFRNLLYIVYLVNESNS